MKMAILLMYSRSRQIGRLKFTQKLDRATPVAYLLTIPAIDFRLGTTLSSIASRGKNLALDYLKSAVRVGGHSGSIEATGSE